MRRRPCGARRRRCSLQARSLVSLCPSHVCLFGAAAAEQKVAASILPLSKNFPTCPPHCGCQPTNQRTLRSRQRGVDANLQQPSPPWHTAENKMAALRTLPQYGCIVWRWVSRGDEETRREARNEGKQRPVSVIPLRNAVLFSPKFQLCEDGKSLRSATRR